MITQKRFLTVRPAYALPPLKERRIGGRRHWQNERGETFPSVTTVLSVLDEGWLREWKDSLGRDVADKVRRDHAGGEVTDGIYESIIRHSGEKTSGVVAGKATAVGTRAHKIIEDYLSNRRLDFLVMGLYEKAHFLNLQKYLDRIDRVRALEANLWSSKIGIAGRVDCVAEYDGVKSIIDFKTSSKMKREGDILSYRIQTAAYAAMWNERQGDDISQGVIIMSGADGGSAAFIVDIPAHEADVRDVVARYRAANGDTAAGGPAS